MPILQAVTVGMAIAGLAISLLSLISLWGAAGASSASHTAADLEPAAVAYFGGAAFVILVASAGYYLLPFLRFWQYHLQHQEGAAEVWAIVYLRAGFS